MGTKTQVFFILFLLSHSLHVVYLKIGLYVRTSVFNMITNQLVLTDFYQAHADSSLDKFQMQLGLTKGMLVIEQIFHLNGL